MDVLIKNPEDGKHYKIKIGTKVEVGDKIPYLRLYAELPDVKSVEALDCEVIEIFKTKKKRNS